MPPNSTSPWLPVIIIVLITLIAMAAITNGNTP